ncbi:MAG TPA: ATP-binding protein [Cyclobacteriaceae bacterium]|nr:ATP-binding protein [Cyclobacteriaceae bacterium]
MLTTSKNIAFFLALAISLFIMAVLSFLDEASRQIILMVGGISFVAIFILLYITLEFLIFKEINNIYTVLDRIQKKNLNKAIKKSGKTSLFPLRKINKSIHEYALAKNKEIETLQKNDTFRREFIADISHELKTPIFAAQGFVHTLLDGAVDDKNVRYKFLRRAAKSLNTLEILVQDLLTLNQMESGVVKFHFEEVDLKEIVAENIEQLEQKALKRRVSIRFNYNEAKQHLVLADKDKISHAIQNLLANAIRYNHEGGDVIIKLKSTKKNVRVSVKDSGKGIPPEDLNRIFERFYRVEKSRSREKGGTGLGLAIVKHILEGHKSKISVTSAVGKGSIFSFSLPPIRVQNKEEAQPENAQ